MTCLLLKAHCSQSAVSGFKWSEEASHGESRTSHLTDQCILYLFTCVPMDSFIQWAYQDFKAGVQHKTEKEALHCTIISNGMFGADYLITIKCTLHKLWYLSKDIFLCVKWHEDSVKSECEWLVIIRRPGAGGQQLDAPVTLLSCRIQSTMPVRNQQGCSIFASRFGSHSALIPLFSFQGLCLQCWWL